MISASAAVRTANDIPPRTPSQTKDLTYWKERAEQVIATVIEPVSGQLDRDAISVAVNQDPPVLTLSHTAQDDKGREHAFRYHIHLSGKKVTLESRPKLDTPAVLHIPENLTEPQINAAQDVFRRACIADPLHPRHNRKTLALDDYQLKAVETLSNHLEQDGHAFLVLGTGGGKTQIAHEIASAFLRTHGSGSAKVIFVVNKNDVLDEAADKFTERFGSEHEASHAHGGKKDLRGHIVYATPGTLLGTDDEGETNRLEAALGGVKEVLLIIDEAHHVVANTPTKVIATVKREAERRGLGLKILGMTATETRPDLKNVLTEFNDRISVDLPAFRLVERGFLAPFQYIAADQWLWPNSRPPSVFRHESEVPRELRQRLNSEEAFSTIKGVLDEYVRSKEDQRTLIVAPGVRLAGQFLAFINQFEEYKGKVVRLTSEDRINDSVRFAHIYAAWKAGKWPEGSPFAGEPVPTIVVSVDLFKEGTDAPGIQTIVNWADTSSLIAFQQTLGRGLRLAPFKTNLDVIDLAGTFRKVYLLQYLGDLAGKGRDRSSGGEGRGSIDESFCDGPAFIELDPETTRAVEYFLADIPALLTRRHPDFEYSQFSIDELDQLHECLAKRAGFDETDEFNNKLRELGELLRADSSPRAALQARTAFLALFYQDPDLVPKKDGDEVQRDAATLLVHAHLLNRLQILVVGFHADYLDPALPEFSETRVETSKKIARNLYQLRNSCFKLSPRQMAAELKPHVIAQSRVSPESRFDLDFQISVDDGGIEDLFNAAEGRRYTKRDFDRSPLAWEQQVIMAAYLAHPRLAELKAQNFYEEPTSFRNLLLRLNLVKDLSTTGEGNRITPAQCKLLRDTLADLNQVLHRRDEVQIKTALTAFQTVLNAVNQEVRSFRPEDVNYANFTAITNGAQWLKEHTQLRAELRGLSMQLQTLVERMCNLERVDLAGSQGYALAMQHKPDTRYLEVFLTRKDSQGEWERTEVNPKWGDRDNELIHFPVRDVGGAPHLVLVGDKLHVLDKHARRLIPPDAIAGLPNALVTLLSRAVARLNDSDATPRSAVVALPGPDHNQRTRQRGDAAEFDFKGGLVASLERSQLNYLFTGRDLSAAESNKSCRPSAADCALSRVANLDLERLETMGRDISQGGPGGIERMLLQTYQVVHYVRSQILPELTGWREALCSTKKPVQYGPQAAQYLEKALNGDDGIGRQELENLKFFKALLQRFSESSDQVAVLGVAAYGAWMQYVATNRQKRFSTLPRASSEISTLFLTLQRSNESQVQLPGGVLVEIRRVLETIYDACSIGDDFQARFPSTFEEPNFEAATALQKKIVSIVGTVGALMRPAQAATSEATATNAIMVPRTVGHPYFNSQGQAVVFLTGTKKRPVAHIDPECAKRKDDLNRLKKAHFTTGPITLDQVDDLLGNWKLDAHCCELCDTPSGRDYDNYKDVRLRFSFDREKSAMLPTAYQTPTQPDNG